MPSIRSTIRLALALVAASSVVWSTADPAKSEQLSPPAGPLPQTDRARLARGGSVGPHDGWRASVRRATDRRQPGTVGALLEVRHARPPPRGMHPSTTIATGCARSSASSTRACLQVSSALATTKIRRSWRRRAAIACTRSAGRCSTAFRPKGCSFSRRRHARSPHRGRARCRADAGADPRPRTRIAAGTAVRPATR